MAGGQPAAAANSDPILIGRNDNEGTSRTRADDTGSGSGVGFLFQSGSAFSEASATFPSALAGYTTKDNHPYGIYGLTTIGNGAGVVGQGRATTGEATGVRGQGDK